MKNTILFLITWLMVFTTAAGPIFTGTVSNGTATGTTTVLGPLVSTNVIVITNSTAAGVVITNPASGTSLLYLSNGTLTLIGGTFITPYGPLGTAATNIGGANLNNWSGRPTNQFAAVPANPVSGNFVAYTGASNMLADSGQSGSSFDAAGSAGSKAPTNNAALGGALAAFNGDTNIWSESFSNAMLQAKWFPRMTANAHRLPPLGIAGYYTGWAYDVFTNNGGIHGYSNAIWDASQNLASHGYRYHAADDGVFSPVLDGNLCLVPTNTTTFSTFKDYANWFHTNTMYVSNWWRVIVYADASPSFILSTASKQRNLWGGLMVTNIAFLATNGLDGFKFDGSEYMAEVGMATLATLGAPIFWTGAVQGEYAGGTSADNNRGRIRAIYPNLVTAFRPVINGDSGSHQRIMEWCDWAMTNKANLWVGPGTFLDMDYLGGERQAGGHQDADNATLAHMIVCALFSSPIYTFDVTALKTWTTNDDLLAIDQDPAVICAQRWLQTNNCDVYIKQLVAPGSDQFALGIINRNTNGAATVTLNLTNLPPFAAKLSRIQTWSLLDCVSNTGWVAQNTNVFTASIGTNGGVLYRLVPGFAVKTNVTSVRWPDSITVDVWSNGVIFSGLTQPWDAKASNYVFRSGITNNTTLMLGVEQLYQNGMQHGWWNKLDALYPFLGATSNSCAQNIITNAWNITWAPGNQTNLTFGWNSVTADGTNGYGDTGFNPTSANGHFQQNNASFFVYSKTAAPVNQSAGFVMIGTEIGPRAGISGNNSSQNIVLQGINDSTTATIAAVNTFGSSDWTGYIMGTRTSSSAQTIYKDSNAGLSVDTTASTGLPNASFYVFAEQDSPGLAGGLTGMKFGMAGFGAAFSPAEWQVFLSDMQSFQLIVGDVSGPNINQTPWMTDIDAAKHSITNLYSIDATTNTGRIIVYSNFTWSLNTTYANLTGTRIDAIGNYESQGTTGSEGSLAMDVTNAGSGYELINGGTGIGAAAVGSTNIFIISLGTNDTFKLRDVSGGGAQVVPASMVFKTH